MTLLSINKKPYMFWSLYRLAEMVKSAERIAEMKNANRGAWTAEEDKKLMDYVLAHSDKKWRTVPAKAGLNRCGKSCRLRWLNYLRPGIKRGNISEAEEDLIIRLHNLLGNRWSLIAGRLPGRTDNEIKNHWNTHLSKRSLTIEDLNSKQTYNSQNHNHKNTSELPQPSSAEFNSIFSMTSTADNHLENDISNQLFLDLDELVTGQETWFQPSLGTTEEDSFRDLSGFTCNMDWFYSPLPMEF